MLYRFKELSNGSHMDIFILEAFRKYLLNSCLMLHLDYTGSCCKYSEGTLSLTSISRLTGLKESLE